MTTDKVFILLLVIMLPLTGCLDMTDNAEAETETTSDTVTSLPMIHSLHLEAGESHALAFDGTNTMILEDSYMLAIDDDCSSDCPENWVNYDYGFSFSMECSMIEVIENAQLQDESILPVLGGEACNVTLSTQFQAILMFSEANLASL